MKNLKSIEAVSADSKALTFEQMLDAIKRTEASVSTESKFEPDAGFITNRLRAEFVCQVREEMQKRGIKNPAQLAKLTGISRERMGKILQEKGNIELHTIAKIALALDAPIVLRLGQDNVRPAAAPQPAVRTTYKSAQEIGKNIGAVEEQSGTYKIASKPNQTGKQVSPSSTAGRRKAVRSKQ